MTGIPITFGEARAAMDAAREANKTPTGRTRPLSKRRRELLASMGLKRCPTCLAIRELDEFGKDRSSRDGHQYVCRKCATAKSIQWASNNREARSAYREATREHRNAYSLAYYKVERHRLQNTLNKGRRRAAKRGLPAEDIRLGELLAHFEIEGVSLTRSYLTGVEMPEREVSFDHVIALGRDDSPGHVLTNIRPCTRPENMGKKDRTPEEYMASKETA